MTIPSTARKAGPLLGTGAQTTWPFTFKVFAPTDIAVTTAVLGVETQLVYGSDYSVALNPNQETSPGGTVTYPISGTPLPTGGKLTIIGNLPYDQPLDLPSGGNFSPLALENQLDRTTMQIQQLGEQVGRALRLPVTSTGANTVLPIPESNNLIGWNEAATGLQNFDPLTLATVVAFASARADQFTGNGVQTAFTLTANPGAQASLDVAVGGVTQLNGVDFTWNGGTTVTFASAPPNGASVQIRYALGLPQGYTDSANSLFLQSGTGAVPRFVQNKLREFVSVADFGAVGDGVADDTAAIQLALNAGLNVDFGDKSKNYKVSSTLLVRSYSVLHGSGARVFQSVLQTPMFDCRNTVGVTISGLSCTGVNMSTATAGAFVVGRRYSIVSVGTTNFTALGAASNTPGAYFTATGAGSGTGVASTFYNRASSLDVCILADYAANLVVRENTFTNFAYSPLRVSLWGANIVFSNNFVTGPGPATLNPLGGDPSVTGFRNCTGVTILGAGVQVQGNNFSGCSQGIIIGQQSRDVLISGNAIRDTVVEHGMYIDTACQHVVIADNTVANTILCGVKVQWYDATVPAPSLLAGGLYVIKSVGTTDFTTIGASVNAVGTVFTATAAGTGTGTAGFVDPADVSIVGNTIENTKYPGGDGIIALNASQEAIASITSITQASPGVFTTAAAHGLAVNDVIVVNGVLGMTPINNSFYVNSVPSSNTFTVKQFGAVLSTAAFPAYTSGGTVSRPVFCKTLNIVGNTVRNCSQDAIGARFTIGAVISNNTIDTAARYGVYELYARYSDVSNNVIRNTQLNGIYVFSPTDICAVCDNTVINTGALGDDTGGNSSGIVVEGDGGVEVAQNTILGEDSLTKMQYGIYITSGDKRRYAVRDNLVQWARDAGARFHANDNFNLLKVSGNIFRSAVGENVIVGLPTAAPGRGSPSPDYYGLTAPTTGYWEQGTRVNGLYPAAGGPLGWVCVVSGTPGTWVPFGGVQSVNPYTVTNPSPLRSINVSTATANDCARVLNALISDMQSAGVLK